MEVQLSANFKQNLRLFRCVLSPGVKNKFSTKLPTIWSHVLDRSAEVQNKLIHCSASIAHILSLPTLASPSVRLSVGYWPTG